MMKTYVLMVSERFPQTHKRKGELTYFPTKIKNGEKIHTIRANYDLWEKRINDIKNGLARLSVRVWEEIAKNDGLSLEDFCDWFKVRSNKPMAIIHFTAMRY